MIDKFLALLYASTWQQWALAFVILLITDVCWARYTVATGETNNPLPAALWAVALFGLGGFAVVGYTTNPILLIPSALGAFVGTYAGVAMGDGNGAA